MRRKEAMTTMFRFWVTEDLDRAVKIEAERLHVKPSELARLALAHGLQALSGGGHQVADPTQAQTEGAPGA